MKLFYEWNTKIWILKILVNSNYKNEASKQRSLQYKGRKVSNDTAFIVI